MTFLALSAAAAAAFVALLVWLGRRSRAPGRVAIIGLIFALGAWAVAFAVESSGWRDTDGWIDCNDYCHGWHYAGAILFWTPPLTALGLALVLALGLVTRFRRR